MKDYPAIFHLQVCRARQDVQALSELLDKMHEAAQRDKDGEYSGMNAIDSESLELLTILSKAVDEGCTRSADALKWHRRD